MTLYRIDTYATSPDVIDITPSGGYQPAQPYALSCDPAAWGGLVMVASDGTEQRFFTSSNYGASWTDNGVTVAAFRVSKRAGQLVILAGASSLLFSDNGGGAFSSKAGDWTTGTIKGFWVVM